MNYLKSEHLKFKRTISNKLLFIIPLITAIFAWIVGGFIGFQYTAFYWWYAFLLPGAIAILCSLSHRKEENAGKCYSVFSMPMSLSKFETAKGIVLIEKLVVMAILLAILISISNIIAPTTVVYSVPRSLIGSIGIIIASVWQIPLCLYLARKTSIFLPMILNTLLGIFLPIVFGNTAVWWMIPYCYAAKMAEPLMGIELNGTFSGNVGFSATVLIVVVLSMLMFIILSFVDAKDFAKRR
ncbi:MAG: lantibiotic immunity ABC transporter MutE/EpiE family permease subunit [Clostridia bacterium]|nr:lantibiotic immunity ABC transporter MutE/EpiE family permease subunit [Clostridia bacterium]